VPAAAPALGLAGLGPAGAIMWKDYTRTIAEAEQRIVCPTCHERVQEDFILCPTCRTRLKRVCPNCAKLIRPEWNICPYCAKDFDERDWTVHTGGKEIAAVGEKASTT